MLDVRGIQREAKLFQESVTHVSQDNKMTCNVAVIPHHLLASSIISRAFNSIDSRGIKQVIIISPDHYNQKLSMNSHGFTTMSTWKTPFGDLLSVQKPELIDGQGLFATHDKVFHVEHGIFNIIPYVKYFFPHARVLPIILSSRSSREDIEHVVAVVKLELKNEVETLVILSTDFVHNALLEDVVAKDEKNKQLLSSLNEQNFSQIENDCKQCWMFALTWLDSQHSFKIFENKNSHDFGGPEKNITSYISGCFVEETNEKY